MKDKGFTKPWQGNYLDKIWAHLYYNDIPILESLIHNRFLEKNDYTLFCTELQSRLNLDWNNNPNSNDKHTGWDP